MGSQKIDPKEYLGLVWSVAHSVAKASGQPVEDLSQEGVFGLLKAAKKFDPSRGVKFASYAHWWIFSATTDAAKSWSTIRLPKNSWGRKGRPKMRPAKVYSLDAPLLMTEENDGVAVTLHNLLSDEESRSPEEHSTQSEVWRALDELPPRTREMLELRFVEDMTLDEIGKKWGLTRQRVHQLEGEALGYLRARLTATRRAA